MFNVILVDDEPFIREALRTLIPWEEYGFQVAEELYNGKEALEYCKGHAVDLIVTDIKMPVMDGLTLIKNLNSHKGNCSILVMSAYDEFHLVKEAFKLGVKDYILKSELEETQFGKLLESMKAELIRKREGNYLIRENLFHLLMEGNRENAVEQAPVLKEIGFDLFSAGFVVFQFLSSNKSETLRSVIDYLEERSLGFLVNMKGDETALLCSFPSSFAWMDVQDFFDGMYKSLKNTLFIPREFDFTIGVSTLTDDYRSISDLYRQAGEALKYSFFRGKNRVIFSYHVKHGGAADTEDFQEKGRLFQKILRKRDFRGLQVQLFDFLVRDHGYGPEHVQDVKKLYQRYYFYFSDFFEQNRYLLTDSVKEGIEQFSKLLTNGDDLSSLNGAFRRCVHLLVENGTGRSSLVNKVIQFIHDHYDQPYSLTAIADRFKVSSGYLSRTFSREVGCSLTCYFSRVKMEWAADFLINSDMKIYEVAELVGYENPEHFSRTFKKIMGKSPKKYVESAV